MFKILKSDDVKVVSKSVVIPDTVIIRSDEKPELSFEKLGIDLSEYKKEDIRILEEYFKMKKEEMLTSAKKEVSRLEAEAESAVEKIKKEAEAFKAEAEKTSQEMIAQAEKNAQSIIDDANSKAEEIFAEAEKSGFKAGQEKKAEEIENCFTKLDTIIQDLKKSQNEQFEAIVPQLKYFAIDIAEKVIFKKIEEDNKYLYELVINALKELKDPEWLTIEVSEEMAGLVSYLEEQRTVGKIPQNANITTSNTEQGDIKIESQSGICDASILTQLKNIRRYFDNYGEE